VTWGFVIINSMIVWGLGGWGILMVLLLGACLDKYKTPLSFLI